MRVSRPLMIQFVILNWKLSDLWLFNLMNKFMQLNPVHAKDPTLSVIENSLRKIIYLMMLQRKERSGHARSVKLK